MRKPILAANWKMYKTAAEAQAFATELLANLKGQALQDDVEILVCPPFTALPAFAQAVKGTPVMVGGQNMYPKNEGAFTGEVSPAMLVAEGAAYVIIGHSERRQIMGEQDAFLNEKVKSALEYGLKPILCVGETLEQRQRGETADFCQGQLAAALDGFGPEICDTLVIAYEPIWAIGTGVNASSDDAQETIGVLRQWLKSAYGDGAADKVRIQYGGSVKPENVEGYLAMPDIDGALIGGAGLVAESFWSMLQTAATIKKA
ncbi:MAG: triose-phosphate isomerase [Clostridiales bacterium]|nr:triose-phosphate isomerase [Clostridiales bacterium]